MMPEHVFEIAEDGTARPCAWHGTSRRVSIRQRLTFARHLGAAFVTPPLDAQVQRALPFCECHSEACLYLSCNEEPTHAHAFAVALAMNMRPPVELPVYEPPDWRPAEAIPEDFYAL